MNPNLDYQQLSRNLLETNIRPVRIGFLLGSNPSKRLVGSVLKINTGLWGGIYNLVCPTDGRLIPDYLLSLLKVSNLDFIAFCGNFQQRARVFDQLNSSGLDADLLKISLDKLEKFGIGIEGTLNGWFTQMIQRVFVPRIGIVDTRKGEADLIDDFVFGVIPQRIKEYFEDRADFISVGRYHRERNKAGSEYDRLIGLLELSDRHIERIVRSLGRTRPLMYSLFLRRQRVIVFGDRNDLLDSCYFWNVRAIFGKDNVSWLPAEQAMAIVSDTKVSQRSGSAESTRPIFLTCLSATLATDIENGIKNLVQPKQYRYRQPGDILRRVPVVSFSADRKIEQLVAHDRIAVVSTSMPRAFIMEYPKTPRWALDVRVLRDRSLGAEGLVLPNLPGIRRILTPNLGGSAPSIRGDVFSFHVSPRTQQVALRMPTDWEVLGAILQRHYPNVALSDQGRYMSLTISLFGGLEELCDTLRDGTARLILDEFMRHHSTGSVSDDSRYRRSLTLEDIRRLVISRVSVRSGRRKQESIRLAEQIIKNLVRIRAMHSGFQLDCTNCNLEEWYAIDEVSETFRCRRCLSIQDRPLSPAISFRLNEALYQAYKSNFAVPALTLGLMARLSKTSFIYSPQITLTAGDGQSSELDIVAIMDGDLFVGEAKSGNSIARRKIAGIGQLATSVGAGCVVFSTTCRDSCHDIDCNECMRNRYYGDNAFTHGSSGVARDWGTRECIKDARGRLAGVGIQVVSICSRDIEQGDMSTMRLRYRPRSIRAPKIP